MFRLVRGGINPALLVPALALLLLTACLSASPPPSSIAEAAPTGLVTPIASEATLFPESGAETDGQATLLAVGDILTHMPQLPAYYDPVAKRYDFSPWFERVAPIFRTGDWVIGNLETPLAGVELKYTGFPRFNAPKEVAEALHGAGVGLISTANNHTLDRGFAGLQRTLRNVRESGLIPVGTADSDEDSRRQVIVERQGIRMGFLAYTYGTNGLPVPEDKPYAVAIIDTERMENDIRRLRDSGADAVTVSLHFGVEYQRMPNDDQIRIARSAVAYGADIVLGCHSHVVQPYDIVEVPAAESTTGENRKGVVIYSLGNFISNQTGNWKDVGLIFGVRLVKTALADGSSVTTLGDVSLTPTWVHIRKENNKRHYTVLPIQQTLDEHDDPTLTAMDYQRLSKLLDGIDSHLRSFESSK